MLMTLEIQKEGLGELNNLTSTGKFDMTVFLENFNNAHVFAHYGIFKVGGPESKYKLTIGNSMASTNNMMFSIQDQGRQLCSEAQRSLMVCRPSQCQLEWILFQELNAILQISIYGIPSFREERSHGIVSEIS